MRKEREDCYHQRDFQRLCKEHWQVSPSTRIRGKHGVIELVGKAYLRSYTRDTLERWAGKVAPPEVKNRPRRPPKKPSA